MKSVSQKAWMFSCLAVAVGLLAASAASTASARRFAPRRCAPPCYEPPCDVPPPCYEPPCVVPPPCYEPPCHTPPCPTRGCYGAYDSSAYVPRQVGREVSGPSSAKGRGPTPRAAENSFPSGNPPAAAPKPQSLPAPESSPLFSAEVGPIVPAAPLATAPGEAEATAQPEPRPSIPTDTRTGESGGQIPSAAENSIPASSQLPGVPKPEPLPASESSPLSSAEVEPTVAAAPVATAPAEAEAAAQPEPQPSIPAVTQSLVRFR